MDKEKISRECLKNLTSEDLMQWAQSMGQTMADYERQFTFELSQQSGFEAEIAKIMMRYANEGRPEHMGPSEGRKQVRFNEREGQGSENRI